VGPVSAAPSSSTRTVIAIRLACGVLALLAWDLSLRFGLIDPLFLATPLQTLHALPKTTVASLPHIAASFLSFFQALALGVGAAIVIGYLVNTSTYASRMFMPIFQAGVTLPKVTLLPVLVLWLGIEKTTIITYGALSAFFPMIVNVAAAMQEVKPNQITLARSLGLSRVAIVRKAVIPAMLPVLASGLFYACNAAMMGVFIVELAVARVGVGAYVHDLAVTFRTPELYAAIILTSLMTIAINLAIWYAARHLGKWRTVDI
jgi:NitT/TauT family transport system permease protein